VWDGAGHLARQDLAAAIQDHIDKAKHALLKEALHSTEVTLSKLIAVPGVELLATFPANLWQQLHSVRQQVWLKSCAATMIAKRVLAPTCCTWGL